MVYAAGITYWEAFLPSVLLALVAAVVLPWLDRNNTVARSATFGACLFLTARYAFWRLTQTLPPAEASLDFAVGVIFAAVEMAGEIGWDRYVGLQGKMITMDTFGASAPIAKLQDKFGFTVDNVVKVAKSLLETK